MQSAIYIFRFIDYEYGNRSLKELGGNIVLPQQFVAVSRASSMPGITR